MSSVTVWRTMAPFPAGPSPDSQAAGRVAMELELIWRGAREEGREGKERKGRTMASLCKQEFKSPCYCSRSTHVSLEGTTNSRLPE